MIFQKLHQFLNENINQWTCKIFLYSLFSFSEQIKEIVKRRHFTLSEDESEATHIIHPSGDADADAYCRPVFKKGERCLVHFYRFPVITFDRSHEILFSKTGSGRSFFLLSFSPAFFLSLSQFVSYMSHPIHVYLSPKMLLNWFWIGYCSWPFISSYFFLTSGIPRQLGNPLPAGRQGARRLFRGAGAGRAIPRHVRVAARDGGLQRADGGGGLPRRWEGKDREPRGKINISTLRHCHPPGTAC